MAGVWSFNQRESAALRAQLTQAREQQAEAAALREQLRNEDGTQVDPQELARLRALRPELARLRGGIGDLRQRATHSLEGMRSEAAKAQAVADDIRARRLSHEASQNMASQMQAGTALVRFATILAGGQTPGSWAEVKSRLRNAPANTPHLTDFLGDFERASKAPGGLAQIEIVAPSQKVPLNTEKDCPHLPILREATSRLLPDGGYGRYYAWLDWRFEEITLPDGDYATWEKLNFTPGAIASPANSSE